MKMSENLSGKFIPNVSKRVMWIVGLIVAFLFSIPMMFGINDGGYRTVVQWPNGTLFTKFSPGVYTKLFGEYEIYPDVITIDYDKTSDDTSTVDLDGISVRYQDGGLGTIYGKDRYELPLDDETMLKLHKAFRSGKGVAYKLIKPVTEESMNLTAGLMTSEGAYAEQRGTFIQWSEAQIKNGKYETELENKKVRTADGKDTWKMVPVIKLDFKTKQPIHLNSDLKKYGIVLSGHQIVDWDFETKTKDQISKKREATMGIITAKADAERAKQDAITAEEKGKAKVMTAKYEKEEEKIRAVVDAEKVKEVAIIAAAQKVSVAEQAKLEAEQKKFAAIEYKQEQILRGEGDGEYKKLVMQADGALAQKLKTYENVMGKAFNAIAQQKWVPDIQMGGSGSATDSSAAQKLIEMLSVKTAKDLSLDLSIKSSK